MADRFLEGQELIDAVREKLGLGPETPQEREREEFILRLLRRHFELLPGDPQLVLHGYVGALTECAEELLLLRKVRAWSRSHPVHRASG
jgi:hypothetical protein